MLIFSDEIIHYFQYIVAGSAAGMAMWTSIYPIDVVKTMMQIDHTDPKKRKYRNMFHAVRSVRSDLEIKFYMFVIVFHVSLYVCMCVRALWM